MSSYINENEKQFFFSNLIDQKQITLDVTFSIVFQFATQLMIFIFSRQSFAFSERINRFCQAFYGLRL